MRFSYESPTLYDLAKQVMPTRGSPLQAHDGSIIHWSWTEDDVRHVCGEPDDVRWLERTVWLESKGYASLCLYAAVPEEALPDMTIDDLGTIFITSAGVLLLAHLYK